MRSLKKRFIEKRLRMRRVGIEDVNKTCHKWLLSSRYRNVSVNSKRRRCCTFQKIWDMIHYKRQMYY